jgi:hypothetical protein
VIRRRPRRHHEDSGTSLIVAIGFVLMVGSISAGLIGLATSGLNNRASLDVVRNRQYAADAAIEQAIAGVRGSVDCSTANGSTPTPYLPFDGVAIRVVWTCATSTAPMSDGGVYAQRNIILQAFCANPADANCNVTTEIIRAQVNFEPASGPVTKTYVQSWNVNP